MILEVRLFSGTVLKYSVFGEEQNICTSEPDVISPSVFNSVIGGIEHQRSLLGRGGAGT